MKHDQSDGLIFCEWDSQGYDPLILIMFIFGLAKSDTKWLPSKYFIRVPFVMSSISLFCLLCFFG